MQVSVKKLKKLAKVSGTKFKSGYITKVEKITLDNLPDSLQGEFDGKTFKANLKGSKIVLAFSDEEKMTAKEMSSKTKEVDDYVSRYQSRNNHVHSFEDYGCTHAWRQRC